MGPQFANPQVAKWSANRKPANCHICGRPTNPRKKLSTQICGFEICGTYLRTAYLCIFGVRWNENPIYVFPEKELRGISPDSTFMCLWAIYIRIPRICPHIGRPILGYVIAHRHMNVVIGTEACNSFSRNICFEFSVLCLCSVQIFSIFSMDLNQSKTPGYVVLVGQKSYR